MRIAIINGNTNGKVTERIHEAVQRFCHPATQLSMITPEIGPISIENNLDAVVSAYAVVQEILKNQEKADAFIIACFSDPGLYAAREVTHQPVIGIAQAAMVTAVQLGYRFSILSPLRRLRPVLMDIVRRYGFEDNCSGIRTVEIGVSEAAQQAEIIQDAFLDAGRQAIELDGAEVVILGGAVLSGMDEKISKLLGVPVLDPVKCAVGQAESICQMNLTTSKVSGFTFPGKKEFKKCPEPLRMVYLNSERS
jgi:allantoin racemase